VRLYFDNNVYGQIQDNREAESIRRWLRDNGHDLVASDEANLGEALAIKDTIRRAERVQLIQAVATWARPPSDLAMAEELFREVARCHPEWVRAYPSHRSKKLYLRERRGQSWDALRADPTTFSERGQRQLEAIDKVLDANKAAQKTRRELRRQGDFGLHTDDPELKAALKDCPKTELHYRVDMYHNYLLGLADPVTPSADTEWLAPLLRVDEMFRSEAREWRRFCALELEPLRTPVNLLYDMVSYCQETTGGGPAGHGSTVDRIHAVYLWSCDAVVTGDEGLFFAMKCAIEMAPHRGRPIKVLMEGTSITHQLDEAIR
jgi:hypothetical protein